MPGRRWLLWETTGSSERGLMVCFPPPGALVGAHERGLPPPGIRLSLPLLPPPGLPTQDRAEPSRTVLSPSMLRG